MAHLKRFVTGKLTLSRMAYFQSIISLQGSQCEQVPQDVIASGAVCASTGEQCQETLSAEALKHIRYRKFRLVELE